MGCGSSKFIPEREREREREREGRDIDIDIDNDQLVGDPACKIINIRRRPAVHLLRRKRRKNNNGITMSKKMLLKHDTSLQLLEVEEENYATSMQLLVVDHTHTHHDHNNNNNNNNKNKNRNRINPTMSMPSSSSSDDDDDIDHDHDSPNNLKHNHTDPHHLEFKEDQEEDNPNNQDNLSFICPGSPSFRVYFHEETQNDNKDHVEIQDVDVVEDIVSNTTSAKFHKGKEKKIIKKGEKGKRFNRVISKKKCVGMGVKNLLNVKSCYHLSCSGNESRSNILPTKLAQ